MMIVNNISSSLIIPNENSKFDSWTQNKRVLGDLFRKNMHNDVQFAYFPRMEVTISSNPPSSQPQISLSSSAAMEVDASTQ